MKSIWTHDNLMYDLAEHLGKNSDRIIWTDMQLGPSGSPRPDVYTIPKSYSNFKPIAYECKVTNADFRSDITKGKWQSYLKFASGVIFAVPAGLIAKEDIPKGCGLIIRGDNGWRVVKGPTLTPIKNNLPAEFWIKLVIDGVDRSNQQMRQRHINHFKINAEVSKKYGSDLAKLLSNRERAEGELQNKIKYIQEKTGELDVFRQAQHWKNDLKELQKLKDELCGILGVPQKATTWEIERILRERIKGLNADYLVSSMRSVVNSTVSSLERQLNQLKQSVEHLDEQKVKS